MALSEQVWEAVRGLSRFSQSHAAGFTDKDLTAQTGKPNHAAQLVEFFNAGAATENAVYTTIDGVTHTTPIAPLVRWSPPIPVSQIDGDSGDNISVEVYWWPARGYEPVS